MKLKILLAALALASAAGAVEMIHNPVLTAPAGQAIEVSAILSGAKPSTRVRLFYRAKGTEQFSSVEMGGSASNVNGEIPASVVGTVGVEYYIDASINGISVASAPASNPKISPIFVTVRRDDSKPSITILSPMEGDSVEIASPVITVSYENGDLGIDASSVILKIDGVPVKDRGRVQAFETLMSYVPTADLSQGEHTAEVFVKNTSGAMGSIKWTFSVDSMGKSSSKKSAYHWDGSIGYETLYGLVSQQPAGQDTPLPYRPYGVNRANIEVNGRGATDSYQLKANVTDEDRSDQQPTDRVTAIIRNDQGLIALGDYSPSFSELTLFNPYYLRGVTLDLKDGDLNAGHSRLMGVYGQMARAIGSGIDPFSGGSTTPTYAQYLYGTRWELGNQYFLMGFNAVTVNDDTGSLSSVDAGTIDPKYTGVGSVDTRIQIPQIYLKMTGELGADYYFNGPSVLAANSGSAYKADLDWNILPWGTHLSFDWKDLGGSFGFLPGGYTTMANPGLIPDYRGFESSISQALFENQFSVGVSVNGWRDDLQNVVDRSPDLTSYVSASMIVAPHNLPSLNVVYSDTMQNNGVSGLQMDADGSSINAVNTDVTDLNVGLGYSKPLSEKFIVTLNDNYNILKQRDLAGARSSQDNDVVSDTLSLFLTMGASSFNVAGSMGYSTLVGYGPNEAAFGVGAPSGSGTNSRLSLAWIQQWQSQVFSTHLGYDLSSTHAENGAAGPIPSAVGDSTRSSYSIGGDLTVAKAHHFGLSLAYDVDTSTTTLSGVSSPDAVNMLLTDASYKWTF